MKTINSKFANLHRFMRLAYVRLRTMIFIKEGVFNTVKERIYKDGDKEFCYLVLNEKYIFIVTNHNIKESVIEDIREKE